MANLYSYNTSSAYKLNNTDFSRRPANEKLHNIEKNKTSERKVSTGKSARRAFKPAALVMMALCFAVAFIIVNGYVKINEAYGMLADLDAEYNDIIAGNQDLQVKIDKAVDLEQLQQVAEEKYGMVRPERNQIFYVDMQQDDCVVSNNVENKRSEKVTMNGVTGTITGAMNIFK